MIDQVKNFASAEDGAVTVDWVVLTAAVCGLALAAFAGIQTGSRSVGENVGDYLTNTDVETAFDIGG